jgi:hypothetical protein
LANDGRDRYQTGYPSTFFHLSDAVAPGAGFVVLAEDMPGGADGDPAFRWAQDYALALIQVAAYNTQKALGRAPQPLAVFDLSAENGDTPIGFDRPAPGSLPKPPRGRHPGGSHDGGVNLDLGYYLTSTAGLRESPDYAACSAHYEKGTADALGTDANMCQGPADHLATMHQTYFILQVMRLHFGPFGGALIDQIGIDAEVLRAVRTELDGWQKKRHHNVTTAEVLALDALTTHDRHEGWQRFHHHHLHLRLQPHSSTGPLREALAGLVRQALQVRGELLLAKHPEWPLALDAELLSSGLGRAVLLHLVPRPKSAPPLAVRYRVGGGEWQLPDEPSDSHRLTLDLPRGLLPQDSTVSVEAEVTTNAGTNVIKTSVALPRQDPRLYIAHSPGQITGLAKRSGAGVELSIQYPLALQPLVTSARYLLFPAAGGEPETLEVFAGWFAWPKPPERVSPAPGLGLPIDSTRLDTIGLVAAEVMLSSRLRVLVPIATAAPAAPAPLSAKGK